MRADFIEEMEWVKYPKALNIRAYLCKDWVET